MKLNIIIGLFTCIIGLLTICSISSMFFLIKQKYFKKETDAKSTIYLDNFDLFIRKKNFLISYYIENPNINISEKEFHFILEEIPKYKFSRYEVKLMNKLLYECNYDEELLNNMLEEYFQEELDKIIDLYRSESTKNIYRNNYLIKSEKNIYNKKIFRKYLIEEMKKYVYNMLKMK